MTEIQNRRKTDLRVEMLVEQMAQVKQELALNTEITRQVRDVLATFRVVAKAAKWTTYIVSAITAIIALFHGVRLR